MSKSRIPSPPFLETARAIYGEAFDHARRRDLLRAMEEWEEQEPSEQSFTVAHLLYLNLQAQAAGQALLRQTRDLLDEVAENLTTALEQSLPSDDDDDLVEPEPEGHEASPSAEAPRLTAEPADGAVS